MNIIGFDKSNHTEELIAASLATGRFPHGAIIEGGTPEERLALAQKIASAIICDDEDTKPCGECNNCRKTSLGLHPDVLIKQPQRKDSAKNKTYFVDYVREIRDDAYIIPNEADSKIYILEEAQTMNEAGQNAFLKILEEPPEFAVFILLTPSKSVFLPTILSRAMVFPLGGDVSGIIDDELRERAAAAAEAVCEAVTADNHFEIVKAAGIFDKEQKLLEASLPLMSDMFMQALKIKYNASDRADCPECCNTLSSKLSKRTLLRLCDDVNILTEALEHNANLNLTIARLCTLFKSASLEQE